MSVFDTVLFVEVFVTLFVIMDPVGTIPIFLSLTSGRSAASARKAAWQAVAVSFFVIVAFAFFGQQIQEIGRMAAEGDTVLSPQLARSMLAEVRKLDEPRTPEDDRVVTKREEEVLQLIADGCSTPEVAERLYISQKTVKNHLASIYQKLDARDRTQAVLQAVRMGIVSLH